MAKGRVAPPMPWRTRLAVLAAGYVTDATLRTDGTVNRRLLSVFDKGIAASAAPRNGVASRDIDIDPALSLHARLFYPCGAPAPAGDNDAAPALVPIIVFFHGGGFAYLSAASPAYDAACRRIARYAGAAVLSVEYRRSPEHRCPAAYDDGLAALRFLDGPAAGIHPAAAGAPPIDAARCFLAGDSAGGNIAHHVARRYALDPSAFRTLHVAGLIAIQPFFGGEERTAGCRFVGASWDGWLALVVGDGAVPAGPLLFNAFTSEEIPLDPTIYEPAEDDARGLRQELDAGSRVNEREGDGDGRCGGAV